MKEKKKTCTNCLDTPLNTPDREDKLNACTICDAPTSKRQVDFWGDETVSYFCQWLFAPQKNQYVYDDEGKKKLAFTTTAIAHNAQGYDLYFIMKYMINNTPDNVIRRGGKVLHMSRTKSYIRFIDSLSFLMMPLSKMPSCFGLPSPKGYFPHLFNIKKNQNYKGHLPHKKYYGYDYMMPKARQQFLEWYLGEVRRGAVFDFKKEIFKYCELDVLILENSCTKFRELFMSLTSMDNYAGVDPFKFGVTLASICNLVFRSLFLEKDTIPLLPSEGFTPKKPQSKKSS